MLIYFEKRRRVLHKGTTLSNLQMRDRSLSLFSFQFDVAFNLLFQMKDYLRSYCFSFLDLRQNRNLKNIALICVTLEKNSKFDTLHSFKLGSSVLIFLKLLNFIIFRYGVLNFLSRMGSFGQAVQELLLNNYLKSNFKNSQIRDFVPTFWNFIREKFS